MSSIWCPMYDHYMVISHEGKYKICPQIGDKTSFDHLQFDTVEELYASDWYKLTKRKMETDEWPDDCSSCREREERGFGSLRKFTSSWHESHSKICSDYLHVEVSTDNICNSACQFCYDGASTKIGSLKDGKNYLRVNNMSKFNSLPLDRITKLDIVGGEPSHSPIARSLLSNLPKNVSVLRFTTNCTRVMSELIPKMEMGMKVFLTVSLDGVDAVYDYVRWPIKYSEVTKNLAQYVSWTKKYENFRLRVSTTVCALNAADLPNIWKATDALGIPAEHTNYFMVVWPNALNPKHVNYLTTQAKYECSLSNDQRVISAVSLLASDQIENNDELQRFIGEQDALRGIKMKDYLGK